ncbi:hypothetical protein SAMN06297387_12266 [Streptomyces zhaozhouensis]|uniref:DUF2690 domain-containing protein n=2 Tax=Streptomyces zhaozhouensis TaxID=1300267 RepID=A0A286E3X2_9ACTN|nr:hypothetical protein SAMN06297387_12266 [Streptomyces zhaozhouensis]
MLTTDGQDYGYIEMRYSPSCQTQWMRITFEGACNGCLRDTTIRRPSGPDGGTATFYDSGSGRVVLGAHGVHAQHPCVRHRMAGHGWPGGLPLGRARQGDLRLTPVSAG